MDTVYNFQIIKFQFQRCSVVCLSLFPETARGKPVCWCVAGVCSHPEGAGADMGSCRQGERRGWSCGTAQADSAAQMFQKLCHGPGWMHSLIEIPKDFLPTSHSCP